MWTLAEANGPMRFIEIHREVEARLGLRVSKSTVKEFVSSEAREGERASCGWVVGCTTCPADSPSVVHVAAKPELSRSLRVSEVPEEPPPVLSLVRTMNLRTAADQELAWRPLIPS